MSICWRPRFQVAVCTNLKFQSLKLFSGNQARDNNGDDDNNDDNRQTMIAFANSEFCHMSQIQYLVFSDAQY